jgi:LysR family transcriptional activator of nhaA
VFIDKHHGDMEWLNYHHLHYFWVVAREGSLVGAGKVLHLSHPTLSAQLRALEERLGGQLFHRQGRRLVLTELGRLVQRYADEIFGTGAELLEAVAGRTTQGPLRLAVGVVDAVPKVVVRKLLQPALELPEPVKLVCHEAAYAPLMAELAAHVLDIVISDAPVPPGSAVKAFSHLLGESGVSFLATRALARAHRRRFPESLHGAPMLLPLEELALRRSLNQWFDEKSVKPKVVAEFEDSALMNVFGADGVGIFPAPTLLEAELCRQQGVAVVGRADGVRERFYALSIERRLKNPAVVAISRAARAELFAAP